MRSALITRLRGGSLAAVALLFLALGACGGSPSATGTARATSTSTTNPLSAPSGGGCGPGCNPPMPSVTITVTPAELKVSPTTITQTQITSLVSSGGSGSPSIETATADLTLSNSSGDLSLGWKISTGVVVAYTATANPIPPRGSTVVQIKFIYTVGTRTFNVVGPVNTVPVTVTLP